jgi:hypothetical protein
MPTLQAVQTDRCQRSEGPNMSYLTRLSISLFAWLAVCALAVLCTVGIARAQVVSLSACTRIAGPKITQQPLGWHLAYACTDATGSYIYQDGASCLHSVCDLDGAAAASHRITFAATGGVAAMKAAIDAEWTAFKWDCSAPPGPNELALCRERMAWISQWWGDAAKDFRPAVWKVKPNGTYTTRPAYTLTNGVLGTIGTVRATVGALCDVTRPTIAAPYTLTTQDIRAEFGTPGLITICTKER